jgi:hypothetical protein
MHDQVRPVHLSPITLSVDLKNEMEVELGSFLDVFSLRQSLRSLEPSSCVLCGVVGVSHLITDNMVYGCHCYRSSL